MQGLKAVTHVWHGHQAAIGRERVSDNTDEQVGVIDVRNRNQDLVAENRFYARAVSVARDLREGLEVQPLWGRYGHFSSQWQHHTWLPEMAGSVMDAVVCEGAPGIVFIGFRLARRLSGKLPELKNDDENGLEKNIKKASPGTGLS